MVALENVELLAPAGAMPQLRAALRYGADAVYGGLTRFGLRAKAGNFTYEELEEALRLTHGAGKRFYLTLNILPGDEELKDLVSAAEKAYHMGVDGAIVADLGAFSVLRERVPQLPLLVSTQANILNVPAARVFVRLGAKRLVLARELSLKQIAFIRQALPENVELEAFVHGAMCMAYSGRCMLSDLLIGRGGNSGACAQPCRWQYHLVEEKRPGEVIAAEEDGRGTSIFSARDLNMLSHLPDLLASGVTSLKIEGRMKTAYYVSHVVSCYRQALDALRLGEDKYLEVLPGLEKELEKASHRVSDTGFYYGRPIPSGGAEGVTQTMEYVADVDGWSDGLLRLTVKNRFYVGDTLEVLMPGGYRPLTVSEITDMETGERVGTVSVAGKRVAVPCPFKAEQGDYVRGPNRNHIETGNNNE